MVRCWDHDPSKRPAFEEVVECLHGILAEVQPSSRRLSVLPHIPEADEHRGDPSHHGD